MASHYMKKKTSHPSKGVNQIECFFQKLVGKDRLPRDKWVSTYLSDILSFFKEKYIDFLDEVMVEAAVIADPTPTKYLIGKDEFRFMKDFYREAHLARVRLEKLLIRLQDSGIVEIPNEVWDALDLSRSKAGRLKKSLSQIMVASHQK